MARRSRSLRRRLVLVVVMLLSLGLASAALGTFSATRQYLVQRTDAQLTNVVRAVDQVLGAGPEVRFPAAEDDGGLMWQALSAQGAVPAVVEIRDRSGAVVQRIGAQSGPVVDISPGEVSASRPDGAVFRTVDGNPGSDWRIRVGWLPGGQEQMLVAARMSENDRLLRRLALVEILATLLVLAGATALAVPMVRRGMRPLDEMAEAARVIGGGDLGRRVDPADAGTEVGRLGLALNAMLAQIEAAFADRERANERLRRFIADASHELRTPVATIRGYAELFRRGAAARPEDLTKAMHRIEAEAVRVSELVDELLLLARLDQDPVLARKAVDLTEIAVDAAADLRAVAPDRQVRVEASGPAMTLGDAARLRQVLGNLLGNVCQHTPAGTGAVVRVTVEDSEVAVAVTDRGPGLTTEQRERAFERFYRGDGSRSAEGGGAGLGLSIVAAIVSAHGGSVDVVSVPGEGATFEVRLPRLDIPDLDELE